MTTQSKHESPTRETPLEEGLRRYAPKDGAARVALLDFAIAMIMLRRK